MKKGLYYVPSVDKIVYISKVKNYEDLYSPPFSIVTYETNEGVYPKTLICDINLSVMIYLGPL